MIISWKQLLININSKKDRRQKKRNTKLFKKALSMVIAAAMTVTVCQTVTFAGANENLKEVSTYEAGNNETYKYLYAGLTWQEYWANEGVYEAGNVQASQETDSRGEYDKGAFDAVSRATTNHGIHRGSSQCSTTIYDEDGNTYDVLYWETDSNGKGTSKCVLTDGRVIDFVKGTITYTDGTSAKKIKLTFKKVTGAKKYTVQFSTTNKFKKVLYTKTVKNTKVTIASNKLKNKKKLYVRVKAVGAKKWSKVVKVKIKK